LARPGAPHQHITSTCNGIVSSASSIDRREPGNNRESNAVTRPKQSTSMACSSGRPRELVDPVLGEELCLVDDDVTAPRQRMDGHPPQVGGGVELRSRGADAEPEGQPPAARAVVAGEQQPRPPRGAPVVGVWSLSGKPRRRWCAR